MTAPHFFAPTVEGDIVRLTGEEASHAARALRVRPGQTITVSDGYGNVVEGLCTSASATELVARVTARHRVAQPVPRVILLPALPKAGKLDLVVQKGTELGMAEVRPWVGARSVVRWDERRAGAAAARWRQVARAAAKQSRRAWLPVVREPGPLGRLPEPTVVLHEGAAARLAEVLPEPVPGEVGLVVGPEGGLEPDEVERLEAAGARPARLGDPIVRAETAAIAGCVLVLARYGLLG